MKNKCLLVLLLALGCCHVQAQKSQKDPLSEALVRLNQKVDSELIPEIKRFPLIGISTDISPKRTAVNTAYVQSVILSGGIPYMIPVTDNVEILRQIVSRLDGIVFTGGEDIQPMYYGDLPYEKLEEVSPARDTFDLMVLKMAADRNIPILGICRGLQLMNVAFGGTLYQDLPTQHPSSVNHRQKEYRHYPHPSDIHHKGKQVGRNYRTRSAASQYIPSSGYPEIGTGIQNHGLGTRQYSGSYRSLSHTTNDRCTISSGNIYSCRRYHHA